MYDGGNSIYYIFTINTNTIPNPTILLLLLTLSQNPPSHRESAPWTDRYRRRSRTRRNQ